MEPRFDEPCDPFFVILSLRSLRPLSEQMQGGGPATIIALVNGAGAGITNISNDGFNDSVSVTSPSMGPTAASRRYEFPVHLVIDVKDTSRRAIAKASLDLALPYVAQNAAVPMFIGA
jgi:hypothetical protein